METCLRVPEQHVLVVDVETYHTNNDDRNYDSGPNYKNTTFLSAADGSFVFPLMFHGGINSKEGAEARLAREPWRPFLNGPVVMQHS